jgi:UDP:flavonoid glycosyltransferase YjiC (YdhE family)
VLAGFPRFDALEEPSNLYEVEDCLADGNQPLVFSHFSLLEPKPDYFTTAVEVARQLGRRAVLLSVRTERPPVALPDGVRHFGYVPLSRLLPRAAALVHHGGIGTLSLALAAGIPQVAVPRFLDQPDNSRRLARLGAAAVIRPRQYRAGALAAKLKGLLDSAEVRDRCRHYAELSRRDDCYGTASAALEGLLGRTPSCPLPLAMPAETAAATAICGEAACG